MAQQEQQDTFLIKLMRMGYFADFYVYPAASIVFLLLSAFVWHTAWYELIILFIFGFALWGFIEYFLHRFAFHHAPLFKQGHGEHHKHPKWHIGTPFFITLPIYVLVGWLFSEIFSYSSVSAALAGFIAGYFGYLIVHHYVHSKRIIPGTFWYRFKKFHDIHHMKEEVNFGVSWQMWDKIFRTHQKSH